MLLKLGSNVSTTPFRQLRQWGFRQCLPFSWTTLRGKHCRYPIAVMGVVDTFGPWNYAHYWRPIYSWLTFANFGTSEIYVPYIDICWHFQYPLGPYLFRLVNVVYECPLNLTHVNKVGIFTSMVEEESMPVCMYYVLLASADMPRWW